MDKDMRLVNIYIKIHNKKTLTLNDLQYLAKYNPECFQKTCDNLVYNMPQSKSLLLGDPVEKTQEVTPKEVPAANPFETTKEEEQTREVFITEFLHNLRKLENSEVNVVQNVDLEEVKELVGNLYMEMMFPHSGIPGYFEMYETDDEPKFNKRV